MGTQQQSNDGELGLGDYVEVGGFEGTIRFIGPTDFRPGEWAGVELTSMNGKNDGSVQGRRYFTCQPNFGMFAPADKCNVIKAAPRKAAPKPVTLPPAKTAPGRASMKSPVKPTSGSTTPRTGTPGANRPGSTSISRSTTPAKTNPAMAPPPKPMRRASTVAATPPTSSVRRTPSVSSNASATGRASATGGAAAAANPRLSVRGGAMSTARQQNNGSPASHRSSPDAQLSRSNSSTNLQTNLRRSETRESLPAKEGSPSPVPPGGRGGSMADREIDSLKRQIEILERKRQEDREKIPKFETQLEKLQADKDKFEMIIQKLTQKCHQQAEELKENRRQLAESEEVLQQIDQIKAENEDLLEMATLDREMAEEQVEVLKTELEAVREKAEELQIEIDILKGENEELSSDMSPEEKTSQGWIQLEKQNERLKDALLRLREITQQTEEDLKETVKSLEEENKELSDYKELYTTASEKLKHAENAIEDLRQQLDAASNAEEMLEELTDRNMNMSEQIEELKATIEDLECLRELSDEITEAQAENEKQMQEEINFKDNKIYELGRKIAQLDASTEEAEYTITRFRDLVTTMQSDLEDMRASQQITEAEANELSARSKSMLDLNHKLQISAAKAQNKTIDLELRRMEAQEASEHLNIVTMFLPEAFLNEKESILALLRFKRVSFKATLLHNFVRDKIVNQLGQVVAGNEEMVLAACEVCDEFTWVSAQCQRFVSAIQTCSVEQFSKFRGALYELDPVERALNNWIEALRKDELKERQCAADLKRTIAVLSHLAEVLLQDNLEAFGSDLYMQTQLMQTQMESTASAVLHVKWMVKKKLPEETGNEEEVAAFYKKADDIVQGSRNAKVVVAKVLRSLGDLQTRSLSLTKENRPAFEECLELTAKLANYSRAVGQEVYSLLFAEDRTEPFRYGEVQSTIFRATEAGLGTAEAEPFGQMSKELKNITTRLLDLGSLASDLDLTAEFDKPKEPWVLAAQALKQSKVISQDASEEIRRLKEDILNRATTIKRLEQALDESSVKIELLESRMGTIKTQAAKIEQLEQSLTESVEQERSMESAVRELNEEIQNLESELRKVKNQLEQRIAASAANPSSEGSHNGSGKPTLIDNTELTNLRQQLKDLTAAVEYYRSQLHSFHHTPSPFSNAFLTETIYTPSRKLPTPPPTTSSSTPSLTSLHQQSTTILSSLITLSTTSSPLDLSTLPPPTLPWRKTKDTPRHAALLQSQKFESLLSWSSEIKASLCTDTPAPNKAYNRRLKKERSKRLEKVGFAGAAARKDWLHSGGVRILGEGYGQGYEEEEGLERFDQSELRPSHVGIAV